MTPGTLVTVFNKHPGVVKANGKIQGPEGYVRVEYRGENMMPVSGYVHINDLKERKK